jgi:dipeptidyl aminopeptidase/acylaminoacyl peptidase
MVEVAPPPSAKPAAPAPTYSGHGAGSVPPEVIARFAPTPLAPEVSRRIQSMLDVRAPGGATPMPDGKSMVFAWSVTGVLQVWRLDGPRRFPVQLTGGEDPTRLSAVSPDGKWLVVSRDRKGEENPGLYLLPPTGGALVLIQHKPNVQTQLAFVSDDSRYVYYTANDRKPDSYAVYRWDIAKGAAELVFGDDGLWSVSDHRPDGRLLLSKATGAMTSEIYEYDPAKKKLDPLLGQGQKEEYDVFYGPEEGQIFVRTPTDEGGKPAEFRRLFVLKDKKRTAVSPDVKMDVSSASIDRARSRVTITLNDGGYTRARAYDAKTRKEIATPAFKDADHVAIGASTPDGRFSTVTVGTAKSPNVSYLYEWATKALVQWVVPSAPEVDTSKFAPATLEHYPARDGTKIPAFVRRPASCAGGCPVLVHFHGGPEAQALPGFSVYAQIFVDAGFVFVEPNVRGSNGYGRAWLHADDGPKRLDVVTDIEDAAKWARTAFAQDGKAPKVGVLGGSYGGYSTLAAMTMFAGAYDAGVANVGIANLLSFLKNTAPYRRALRISEYGDPDKDHDALVKLSPVTYIDRVAAPLMLIQGASDPRVPVGEALQMHAALEARGQKTKLMIFPDEGHGAQKRENKVFEIGHTLDFFEVHLKGKGSTPAAR